MKLLKIGDRIFLHYGDCFVSGTVKKITKNFYFLKDDKSTNYRARKKEKFIRWNKVKGGVDNENLHNLNKK